MTTMPPVASGYFARQIWPSSMKRLRVRRKQSAPWLFAGFERGADRAAIMGS
jgi:hypothetical protein